MTRILLLATLFAVLVAPPAQAKVIFVNTGTDMVDYGAACSLRDAVRSANDNIPRGGCATGEAGLDEIQLPAGNVTLSIGGKYDDLALYGDLDVAAGEPLAVYGSTQGSLINAAGVDRVFDASAPLTIQDVTVKGGRPGADATGGTVDTRTWGGAIRALGSLSLLRVTLQDNATADAVGSSSGFGRSAGSGGAVSVNAVSGTVSIVDSVFEDNHTGDGAPIPSGGTSGGSGGGGGALSIAYSTGVTISGSRFTGNRTGKGGDGDGTFGFGGAGSAIAVGSGGAATITNTVVSGNTTGAKGVGATAPPGSGAISSDDRTTLQHVTVAGNAIGGGSLIFANGLYGSMKVHASVLAGPGTVCESVQDYEANISPAGSGCPGAGGDPLLDEQLIPAANSPAIDNIGGPCPATDVRGVVRPQGAACDAGAIERRPSTLTLGPAALTFAPLLPGVVSATQQLELNYTGDGALRLAAAPLTTTGDFAAAGCSGAAFVDSGSCTVSVTFMPTLAGPRAGMVTVATPAGTRSTALTGTGLTADSPPPDAVRPPDSPPPSGSASGVARLMITGASLRRLRGRLRLRVTLRCEATSACDESLRIRVARSGRRTFFASRREQIAAGGRRTELVPLPPALVRGLRKRANLSVRLRLVKLGQRTVERRQTSRVP